MLPLQDCTLFSLHNGFVTDGEFNSLRTRGEKRPLHVVQLIREARESVSRNSETFLLKLPGREVQT